jgi:hypothetical protein
MAVGESQFLASQQPNGPLWSYDYSGLPPLAFPFSNYYTAAGSPDGLWTVISESDFLGVSDSVSSYIWHDGVFTSGPQLSASASQVQINDQGNTAVDSIAPSAHCAITFSPLGCIVFGSFFFGDPDWSADYSRSSLNDDDQPLVGGFFGSPIGTLDYLLFDPPGAPAPVPEPAFLILVTILVVAIPVLRWRRSRN